MTKTFGLFGAVAVLAAATALSGCGGGGGGGGFGVAGSLGKQPSLTAGGVRASMANTGSGVGNTTILIRTVGGISWSHDPTNELAAPSGWVAETKLNAPPAVATHRFHAVTDYNTDGDNDYLAYGFWSRNVPDTLDASGFRSFFYGNMPYAGNVLTLPVTTVTYTGGAAGVYNKVGTSDYGHFKANFQLRASFGPLGNVNASLTGIEGNNGAGTGINDISNMIASLSRTGFTGTHTYGGRWGGLFFGPSGTTPTGVAGWFEKLTGHNSADDAFSLHGTFGATR